MQSRVESLQKNVEELKDALQKSQAASGASSASGVPGSAGTVGAPGAEGTAGAAGAVGASASVSTPPVTPAQDTGAVAAREVKTGLAKVKQYASDHVLGLVLGISALLALLIAFLLKRAGNNARSEDSDQVPQSPPGLASDFDQKLQSIDLNLSADDKPTTTPASGSTKTSA